MNFFTKIISKWNEDRKTQAREVLLNPNKGSRIKVEEYEYPLSQAIVIGTILSQMPDLLDHCPQCCFKAVQLICNVPCPSFVFIRDIKASNISASISVGVSDAYAYHARANGPALKLPMLSSYNRLEIDAFYTGYVPIGYQEGMETFFTAVFFGPATLAGDLYPSDKPGETVFCTDPEASKDKKFIEELLGEAKRGASSQTVGHTIDN